MRRMSDEKMIRLENLELILRERQWDAQKLSDAMPLNDKGKRKWSRSQCADLLAGRKSFGEKAARFLEEQVLHIPRFWLDQPHDASEVASLHAHYAGNALKVAEKGAEYGSVPQNLGIAPRNNSHSGSKSIFHSPSLVIEWAEFGSRNVSEVVDARPFDALVAPGHFPATFEMTKVAGDWMEPEIKNGDFIWVDRTVQPASDDIVIAEDTKTGRSFLGLYEEGYGGNYYVTPRKGKPADSSVHPIRVLAVMMCHLKVRRGVHA